MAEMGKEFWAKARKAAKMSLLTYETPEDFEKEFPGAEYIKVKETVAYVWKPEGDRKSLYVAFRGTVTSESENILTDIDFKRDRAGFMKGTVHGGFKDALGSIWDKLYEKIKDCLDNEVTFCGHSLGGALAVLAAARSDREHVEVYTFGCPRVGDANFAKNLKCKDRIYRFINGLDIVTRSPWRIWGYVDLGKEFRFDQRGNLNQKGKPVRELKNMLAASVRRVSPDWFPTHVRGLPFSEITILMRRLFQGWTGVLHFEKEGLSDHSMTDYQKYIERTAKKIEEALKMENEK